MARLTISLLGPFRLTVDGEPVADLAADKARALLAYLAVEADRPHRRDALVGLLWPDQPQRKARHSLRQALSHLRRAIGAAEAAGRLLRVTREAIQFNAEGDCQLDVALFISFVADCQAHRHRRMETCQPCMRRLEQAMALYRGDFMAGCSWEDGTAWDEWVSLKQEWLQRMAVDALRCLAGWYERRAAYERARRYALWQVELVPWYEEAQRQLMRLLALEGQRDAALAQYETCRQALAQELAIAPTVETTTLYERIRTGAFPPPVTSASNLPSFPTSFVGREQELAELAELLADPDCRLLTLVGPGGIGKSRLALQVAQEQVGAFAHGVHFVSLAAVSAAEFVVPAIADALGLELQGRQDPREQLLNYLREKEMLLVLDNLEHIPDATTLLDQVLRHARGVVLLATAREWLNLQEEWVYEVGGLGYPQEEWGDGLKGYSAIELFLERARRARGDCVPAGDQARWIVKICQLVEGMPLAVELAAAWVAERPVPEIAREIDDNLDILTTARGDVAERHRSVRATFEHSWGLLSAQERRAFARLSVLRGGFEREAGERVAEASLLVLASLVHKSLLRRDACGRYQVHQLLGQFAAEQLACQPDRYAAVRDRHCTYYAEWLRRQGTHPDESQAMEALAAMRDELENVRAAWQWAVTRAKLAEIERCLAGLSRFYLLRGPFQEGQALIEAAVNGVRALTGGVETAGQRARTVLARLLVEQARLLNAQDAYDEAIAAAQAAAELAPTTSSHDLEVAARCLWGRALELRGNYQAAQVQLEQTLERAQAASLRWLEADSLLTLGSVSLRQGDYAQARVHLTQALNIYQEIGNQRGENDALDRLGVLDYRQGHHAAAKVSFEKSLHIFARLGDRRGEARLLNNLGNCTAELGDYTEARSYYQQALRINREIGQRRGESNILNNLAALFWSCGDYGKAWDHYGQALHIYREIGDQQGVGLALSNLSLLSHLQGHDETALDYGQQALRIAQELGDEPTQGQTLTRLGYALAGLGRPSEAEAAYQQALALQQALGLDHLAMETRAGWARLHLTQNDLTQAQAQVEEILSFLETDSLQGTDEPLRAYLTCYRVLRASQDPRAATVLTAAQRLLQAQAAKIADEKLRRSFLDNVAAHREILAASTKDE
jgi:predicted ATPase/DNA-binding SARP family transcriptional activator/Tfp pilus assembly protein PilF